MKNEITRRVVIAIDMVVIVVAAMLLVSWLFNNRAERREVDYNKETIRIEENLQTALDRNRSLEAGAVIQRERIRELEVIVIAERETVGRLEESDNRSRAGLERIESILVDGTNIIDELIRFFESYED